MPPAEHNPPMVPRLQAQTRPFVPANTENFLADVCKPELSLAELARRYSTTVDALSVWLSRPDVVQRLAEIRSVSAQRAGFIAGMHLPYYANSLADSLAQAVTESKCMSHFTLTIESNTLRVRYRENIRKTVALLANIARYERSAARWAKPHNSKPKNPAPTSPPSNSPRPPTAAQSPRPEPRGKRQQPSPSFIRTNSNAPTRAVSERTTSRHAPKPAKQNPKSSPKHAAPTRASTPSRAATSARRSPSPSVSRANSRSRAGPTPRAAPPPASKRPRGRPSSNNSHQSRRNSHSRPSEALTGPAP